MLSKLAERDEARQLSWPKLEDLCLFECEISAEDIKVLQQSYPHVHIHERELCVLDSSTWVEDNAAAYKTWHEYVWQMLLLGAIFASFREDYLHAAAWPYIGYLSGRAHTCLLWKMFVRAKDSCQEDSRKRSYPNLYWPLRIDWKTLRGLCRKKFHAFD